MTSPIVNPEIPYNGKVPGELQPGWMCRIQGVTHPEADRFNINFQVGPNAKPRDDTALHISVRLNQGYIARNSYKDGSWGDEQGNGTLPIGPAQSWEMIILVDQNDYKIAVNGQHYCEFPFRIPCTEVTHLLIDGDVSITLISWEGIAGISTGENSTSATQLNTQTPQNFGGPPPQGNYGNPQMGYGPAPGGYGPPPPPGAQPESGFGNFLEQAQTVLAGAIQSGAAEKLLGGLLSSGGQPQQQGYAPQNAQYGQYPLPPQQEQRGPVENLLSNFLGGGGGGGHQQTHQPQSNLGGGESIGGLGSMSGILSGLAGSLLQPRDNQNQRQHY